MKHLNLSLLTLFVGMSLAVPARAQHHGHHHETAQSSETDHHDMMQTMHRMMDDPDHRPKLLLCLGTELGEELDLSPVQLERIEVLRVHAMSDDNPHAATMKAATEAHGVLSDRQRAAFDALDGGILHRAMMARMRTMEQAGHSCPMMTMAAEPSGASGGHQH
jgi:hypothetical protein